LPFGWWNQPAYRSRSFGRLLGTAERTWPGVERDYRQAKAEALIIEDDQGMNESPVTYYGLKPIPLNEPVIDFETDDGLVLDLHNGGHVVGIEMASPSDLLVRLTYVEPARWTADAAPEREVELRFGSIRRLTVTQEDDHADEASSTFEDLTSWPSPSPLFMLRTGNFEMRFDAASVHLEHRLVA
jgi:hypothetical protein